MKPYLTFAGWAAACVIGYLINEYSLNAGLLAGGVIFSFLSFLSSKEP